VPAAAAEPGPETAATETPGRVGRGLAALALALSLLAALVFSARLEAPPPSSLLLDRHGHFLGEIGGSEAHGLGYWPLDRLPPRVVAATLAAEDRRFWHHPGIDPIAVMRALWQNLRSGSRVSGASTIAMQVARLQHPGPRSYPRKLKEALLALALTARHGREAVLRHYLCLVPYGNRVHGIAAAARRYFDKPVTDLSWAEVALLAAIPQAPGRMNPLHPKGRRQAVARGERILARLAQTGGLSAAEHALAVSQIRSLTPLSRPQRPQATLHALFSIGARLAEEGHAGGVVRTTLDLELQREAGRLAREAVEVTRARGAANAALMVVDLPAREVLAAVGSTGYFDASRAGAMDYTQVARSPGSTLKPFLYALALERGAIGPLTPLDDLPGLGGGIQNADGRYLGPLLPRVALANSRNVPAAELLRRVGLDVAYAFLGELGLHDGRDPPRRFGLGLAVGGMPVSMERLATAYCALGRGGRLGPLRWRLGQAAGRERQVLSEDTARRVDLMLSDPQARLPTFPRMGNLEYAFPVAVKTGTSSFWHDAWAVAWSRRYLVVAWLGRPDGRAMEHVGGYAAAGLVRKVLRRLHPEARDGQEDVGFPPPRGTVPVRVCALTGKRATPACDQVYVEHLRPAEVPVEPCPAHRRLAVDSRNGLLATQRTPAEFLQVRSFVDLGPRYAAWQVAQGLPLPPTEVSPLGQPGDPVPDWSLAAGRPIPTTQGHPHIQITSPRSGLRLVRDPESPPGDSIGLAAAVEPPVAQLVWYVDGHPFRVADRPYTTRWPLQPGVHEFQARLPFSKDASASVRITVD